MLNTTINMLMNVAASAQCAKCCTTNLPTKIMDFRGFDSSIIFILRGGIPRPIGNFPESLGQAILVGTMLVGRLGVLVMTIVVACW